MSRALRKLNRHVRTVRRQITTAGDTARNEMQLHAAVAIDEVAAERARTLDRIRAVTRPGIIRRMWRWLFA